MSKSEKLDTVSKATQETTTQPSGRSRRSFLANSGMFTAGMVGSALLGACNNGDNNALAANNNDSGKVAIGGPPDVAILNFALNLEYLEAEYYLRAVTGNGLQNKDRGENPGMVTIKGQPKVDFSGGGSDKLIGQYAAEIAQDELHHVQFLRKALGGHAAAAPAIDLQNSFMALGNLIGVPNFDPFSSPENFLLGAFIFEDVGVTAYHGGAAFLKNRAYLDAAAGILAVEAYHAGLVRTFLTAADFQSGDTTFADLTDKISGVRDKVDGNQDVEADYSAGQPPVAADDDQGITGEDVTIYGSDYSATNIVPTNANGLAYNRSVAQVHNIAYATPKKVSQGGFFPNGTNIPGFEALSMSADNTGS